MNRSPAHPALVKTAAINSHTALLVVFTATAILSAALVFAVQPLFARMILPLLGGAPLVWNAAMFFYQGMLLLGYGYVHVSGRWMGLRTQTIVQMVLLGAGALCLPIAVAAGSAPGADQAPLAWLLGTMAVALGLPFFVVSTTATLLQRWFSLTKHPDAANPYFLYAGSNLGSIAGLLAYPAVIEPSLRLVEQSELWTWGYLALMAAMAGSIYLMYNNLQGTTAGTAAPAAPLTWGQRAYWTLLAFVPSSLLLGVTSFISIDLASIPLLWVIPLALYLLSFVLVFARVPPLRHAWMVRVQPALILPLAITYRMSNANIGVFIPLHLLAFFVTAMVCHGELAKRRPAAFHLTEFYFWIALGGAAGGAFNAVLAPSLFDTVVEYPVAILLACLVRPRLAAQARVARVLDVLLPLTVFLLLQLAPGVYAPETTLLRTLGLLGGLMAIGLLVYSFSARPLRFGLGIAAILFGFQLTEDGAVLDTQRSFYGVHRVTVDRTGKYLVYYHGTTIHDAEYRDPARFREPLGYYHRDSPIGRLFEAYPEPARFARVAVVGLGTGAVTCYRQPGQTWDLYEIDPEVIDLAWHSGFFHHLEECAPGSRTIQGDARLSLANAPDRAYDLMILDAYNSDAIPFHLLTREAIALYKRKLTDRGIIAAHISNRYLDLERLFATQMADAGLFALVSALPATAMGEEDRSLAEFRFNSRWVVVAASAETLSRFDDSEAWRPLVEHSRERVWTDDYSNLLAILLPD